MRAGGWEDGRASGLAVLAMFFPACEPRSIFYVAGIDRMGVPVPWVPGARAGGPGDRCGYDEARPGRFVCLGPGVVAVGARGSRLFDFSHSYTNFYC